MKKTVKIEGMSCSHCAARVEKALNAIDGVSAKVDLKEHLASLELSKEVSDAKITETIEEIFYQVSEIKTL